MTFADQVLDFHRRLKADWSLPEGFDLLFPYAHEDTWEAMTAFYQKYYADEKPRVFLFGINPGRFWCRSNRGAFYRSGSPGKHLWYFQPFSQTPGVCLRFLFMR